MISKELTRAIATGKVIFGHKAAKKNASDAKAFIVSMDAPSRNEMLSAARETPVYVYNGTNMELGAVCGRPFGVSIVTILDEGKSNVLNLIKG